MIVSYSKILLPQGKLPPIPKTNLTQPLTLTGGQFLLGANVWLPPNPKINLNLDPNPNPNRGGSSFPQWGGGNCPDTVDVVVYLILRFFHVLFCSTICALSIWLFSATFMMRCYIAQYNFILRRRFMLSNMSLYYAIWDLWDAILYAFKAFIKPFEAPQGSVKIKI